jgi:dipeptidase E
VKIYASSNGLWSQPSRFRRLFGGSSEIAVIPNALDISDDRASRKKILKIEFKQLSALGLRPSEIDLRAFFAPAESIHAELERFGGVWVMGGNCFILRRAMSYSGFDQFIWHKHKTDPDFVYGGYSAGSCVLAASLKGVELMDPPTLVPKGYKAEIIWEGLGILDFSIAPHFESAVTESPLARKMVDYFGTHDISYRTLRDGEAIVVGG